MSVTISGDGTITGLDADGISSQPVFPGNVLQVVSTTKTDTFSTSSTSFVDVTGLTVSITPISTSSKILIIAQVSSSGGNGSAHQFKINGGNSSNYVGDAAGSRTRAVHGGYWIGNQTGVLFSFTMMYLDSPSTTSSTTYAVQARKGGQANLTQVNYAIDDFDGSDRVRGASTITVMEIAA
jgi:hypothetical protein